MNLLYMVTNYLRYIAERRDMNKRQQKAVLKKYNFNIRMVMRIEYTFFDMNKIFTYKLFDYIVAYDALLRKGNLDFTKFNKVSHYDLWLLDGRESSKRLYKHIFRLMEDNQGFNLKYLEHVADIMRKMAKRHGEDPIRTYFRNYNQFKLMSEDRFYFEKCLGIDFDDYFAPIPDLCIEEILHISKSHSLNNHIIFSLLNNHGINVLEMLNIKEEVIA